MGVPLKYVLSRDPAYWRFPDYLFIITYGKCIRSPYIDNELWFVTTNQRDREWFESRSEDDPLIQPHTFIVDKEFAHPMVFEEWKRDVGNWRSVAYDVIIGSWCAYHECLWEETPIFKHTYADGTVAEYGYSRAQFIDVHDENYHPSKWTERKLGFLVLQNAKSEMHESFLVDKLCLEPEFLEWVGPYPYRWSLISWCHTSPPRSAREMATQTLPLDSPFPPKNKLDIYSILEEGIDPKTRAKNKIWFTQWLQRPSTW